MRVSVGGCLALLCLATAQQPILLDTTVAIDGESRPLRVFAGQSPADAATAFAREHGLVSAADAADSLIVTQLTAALRERLGARAIGAPRVVVNVSTDDGRTLRFVHDGAEPLADAVARFCDSTVSAVGANTACRRRLEAEALAVHARSQPLLTSEPALPTASRALELKVDKDGASFTLQVAPGQTAPEAARSFCLRPEVGVAAIGGLALDRCIAQSSEIIREQLAAPAPPVAAPLFTVPVRLAEGVHEVPYYEGTHPSAAAAAFCSQHWQDIERKLDEDETQPTAYHEQEW